MIIKIIYQCVHVFMMHHIIERKHFGKNNWPVGNLRIFMQVCTLYILSYRHFIYIILLFYIYLHVNKDMNKMNVLNHLKTWMDF